MDTLLGALGAPGFGQIATLLGAAVTSWLAYVKLVQGQAIGNRPLLLFGFMLIATGVQLLTLGLLAEVQARTYHESQDKPTYIIREIREDATPPVA